MKLLVLLLVLFISTNAFAWGDKGHIIVAKIAQSNLSKNAKTAIKELMGTLDLPVIANWADQVREGREFGKTKHWHYVDIPFAADTYDSTRDCKNGDCLIAAITSQIAILKQSNEPTPERRNALKFIVHFIGDLHQPLHCYDNNDRGGNEITVRWLGKKTNLHAVWDNKIITYHNENVYDYTARLKRWLKIKNLTTLTNGTITDWANEAHQITQNPNVIVANNSRLNSKYYYSVHAIADRQLATAGVRLAEILNSILL